MRDLNDLEFFALLEGSQARRGRSDPVSIMAALPAP